jgi:imidazolonepropionase-like amidohydrolase
MDNDRGLTAVEALRAATITAAKVIGRDALVGSLEPGKLADYVVVEGDILNRPEGLRGARVLATVVGGKEVYRAGGPSERPSPCA